jgi:Xaa-Pro aminopeptidase
MTDYGDVGYGTLLVDYEARINFDKLRKDRVEKAKRSLKDHGLDAAVCFDTDNIRYVTAARIGDWARGKMGRWCILPANGDPISFEFGGRIAAQMEDHGATWLGNRIKPAISWGQGAVPRETGAVRRAAEAIKQT